MPIKKRITPECRRPGGFDGYECTSCGAHSYNSVRMTHKPDCPEAKKPELDTG